ncbi:hypothetical protein K8I61_15780 [bacterium]|nr:hypothetical protein [bacterium]
MTLLRLARFVLPFRFTRTIAALLILVAALVFMTDCSCGGDDDDDASGDDAQPDDDADDDTASDDDAAECATWRDCDEPLVCKNGACVEPVFPELNPDALRRPEMNDPDGTVLVNGRLLRPAAPATSLSTFPTRMQLSPDGEILAINENGFGTIVDPSDWEDKRHFLRIVETDTMTLTQAIEMPNKSMYIGLRFSADGSKLYVSGGNDEMLHVYDVSVAHAVSFDRSIAMPGCYTTDIVLNAAGTRAFVSCDLRASVKVVNLNTDNVIKSHFVHERPYMLALSADEKTLFVGNWATFGVRAKGDTITVLDLDTGAVTTRIHVGMGPTGLVMTADKSTLWVVNNKQDELVAIDTATVAVARRISLHGDASAKKGIGPVMAALSPDETTLYVTGAGENLVAVVDLTTGLVRGDIPTEWYPNDIAVSDDGGTLYVLNGKGQGDGPVEFEGDGEYTVGRQLFGSVMKIPVPDTGELAEFTQTVFDNNHRQETYFDHSDGNDTALPSPGDGEPGPIRYVFLVLKENFSYDAAFGDFESGKGEPDFTLWTEEMIPNHRALARQFTLLDNFYCDSESSIDGHQWATAGIEPDFVEKSWVLSYADWGIPTPIVSLTPGMLTESPFFMPHLINHGLFVRAYGGIENFGPSLLTGDAKYVNLTYPFNLNDKYRDRDRAYKFVKEFDERLAEGTVPAFSWIFLPNNHAFGVQVGEYTPEHWVADNDEGLGIVVDAIANSAIWEESAIFVFEDDSQHGFDHVDKHRCPALVISPWARREYVSSVAYSMPNIHKSIELILGAGPMHRFDGLATGMYDIFTARPDAAPYAFLPRVWPEEIYGGKENELTRMSARFDWSDIDKNPRAAELYWRWRKGTEPPKR